MDHSPKPSKTCPGSSEVQNLTGALPLPKWWSHVVGSSPRNMYVSSYRTKPSGLNLHYFGATSLLKHPTSFWIQLPHSWKMKNIYTLRKTNMFAPENRPTGNKKSSNHPCSGAFAVSSRDIYIYVYIYILHTYISYTTSSESPAPKKQKVPLAPRLLGRFSSQRGIPLWPKQTNLKAMPHPWLRHKSPGKPRNDHSFPSTNDWGKLGKSDRLKLGAPFLRIIQLSWTHLVWGLPVALAKPKPDQNVQQKMWKNAMFPSNSRKN